VVNSTFFSNYTTWEGGAIANDGPMTVTNCTFSHNTSPFGGAIANSNVLQLQNSIITDSMIGNNCDGFVSVTDGGGNLRWPATDPSCVGSYGDPRLLPLEQNGGPTLTMAIQLGSAAMRLAMANCPATDQRGMPRGLNPGRCDAGAYEWQGRLLFFPAMYHILFDLYPSSSQFQAP
jgi:predicted outer membrane repeat protein